MSRCEYKTNGTQCASSSVPAGGQFTYCLEHHNVMLRDNTMYMLNTCSWQILPETLNTARDAAENASKKHMVAYAAQIEIQDAELRGEIVDPATKAQVFRTRFDALDKWIYLRDIHKELERASQARALIETSIQKRRDRDMDETIRESDAYLRRFTGLERWHDTSARNGTLTLDGRRLTEFAM